MAKSNRDYIGDMLDILRDGLAPYVLRMMKYRYRASRYLQELELILHSPDYSPPHLADEETALNKIDVRGWLKVMWNQWNDVFKQNLGFSERSYVSELIDVRNKWAHQEAFKLDYTIRAIDTARLLLRSIGATREADMLDGIHNALLRQQFERDKKKSIKKAPSLGEAPTTKPGLKPWRDVIVPHADVAMGRYEQAEFAADLAQVVSGKAASEYSDPREFFRRTYLTEGLLDMLATGIKRLNGLGGAPVVQLQTSFGGGKTHSMLALYHLAGGQIGFNEIPGGDLIAERVGKIDEKIEARRAVIVGTAFSATEPRQYKDCTTHTLWGEIAYQLGGVEAYAMVEKADLSGVSPGSDTLLHLLEQYGPALIIIDELVAFARNLYNVNESLPAGTFDNIMTFVQALTEAVKRSSDSMLIVSIPESDIEIGGEGGRATLEYLTKTIGRIESVWKPITAIESFEIVRRRLFSTEIDHAARDAVIDAFYDMYAKNKGNFPTETAESDYKDLMRSAYPIHPELFARLYEDWSTLERFQRTRGVLRLMATVIHQLWQDNDNSLLIMPATIPLWAAPVHNELLRYLPEGWSAIVDSDIDGLDSKPYQIDKEVPNLGRHIACRRVARTIFIGSAPSVADQSIRGLDEGRIHLATVQPGENPAIFNDALRRMISRLAYLYHDGRRYWYDTRPNVNRTVQDRARAYSDEYIQSKAYDLLRRENRGKNAFQGTHVAPEDTSTIVDEPRVRLVVLPPDCPHNKNEEMSKAQKAAKDILETRGNGQRFYRNMLVFLAPDQNAVKDWLEAIREYLAWCSIEEDRDVLNLTTQQLKQVENAIKNLEKTVQIRMQTTYSWLIVPKQPDAADAKSTQYVATRLRGENSFYERAASKLKSDEQIIDKLAPEILMHTIEEYNLWGEAPHLSIKQLWEHFAQYCYLPRLSHVGVLLDAIARGSARTDALWGYADAVAEDGTYKNLTIGKQVVVSADGDAVIVRPDVAHKQLAAMYEAIETTTSAHQKQVKPTSGMPPSAIDERKRPTNFHSSIAIDPLDFYKTTEQIADEIIQYLSRLTGTDIEITLEIHANRPEGFDDNHIRTLKENCRTLRFRIYDFDE